MSSPEWDASQLHNIYMHAHTPTSNLEGSSLDVVRNERPQQKSPQMHKRVHADSSKIPHRHTRVYVESTQKAPQLETELEN